MLKKNVFLIVVLFALDVNAQVEVLKSHDSNKPVEISSETLEVLQLENKAIFSGDVQAKQGSLDIRAEKMTVFYKENNDKKKSSESKVSKVEIDNNVFISTPSETAKGNKGVYDVDQGVITLEGDVTLTSGKNIVKGRKLIYSMKTGQSKMVGDTDLVKSSGAGKKERVRGVFIPDGKK